MARSIRQHILTVQGSRVTVSRYGDEASCDVTYINCSNLGFNGAFTGSRRRGVI